MPVLNRRTNMLYFTLFISVMECLFAVLLVIVIPFWIFEGYLLSVGWSLGQTVAKAFALIRNTLFKRTIKAIPENLEH